MRQSRQMEPPTRHVPDDQSESPGNTACQAQEGNALEGGDSQKEMTRLESVRVLTPIKQWIIHWELILELSAAVLVHLELF